MKYLFSGIALLVIAPGFKEKPVDKQNGALASAHPLATKAGLNSCRIAKCF